MKTQEGNKLIAEFVGLTPKKILGRYSISKDHCHVNCSTEERAINDFFLAIFIF